MFKNYSEYLSAAILVQKCLKYQSCVNLSARIPQSKNRFLVKLISQLCRLQDCEIHARIQDNYLEKIKNKVLPHWNEKYCLRYGNITHYIVTYKSFNLLYRLNRCYKNALRNFLGISIGIISARNSADIFNNIELAAISIK